MLLSAFTVETRILKGLMDNIRFRVIFDLGRKKEMSGKNILKLVRPQSLVANCCKTQENITLRSLYTFVLRAETSN